jgi:DNA-binding NarL/FixJ family response regulator
MAVAPDSRLMRIVVVDDHRAFAEALGMALAMEPDLSCAGLAATASEGLELIASERPDVAIVDVMLPDLDGIEVTRQVRQVSPSTRVIVLTARTDVAVMAEAASAGACGFVPKERPLAEILTKIRTAAEGEISLDRSTLVSLVARRQERSTAGRPATSTPLTPLTPRELGVLSLLAEGVNVRQIAKDLRISVHTCRGAVRSILRKLGAHSQLEAVVKASRAGLLPARW